MSEVLVRLLPKPDVLLRDLGRAREDGKGRVLDAACDHTGDEASEKAAALELQQLQNASDAAETRYDEVRENTIQKTNVPKSVVDIIDEFVAARGPIRGDGVELHPDYKKPVKEMYKDLSLTDEVLDDDLRTIFDAGLACVKAKCAVQGGKDSLPDDIYLVS